MRLQHLAGRVWLHPFDRDPANVQGCVAVIIGERDSVVVDAGNSPSRACDIQGAMRDAGVPDAATVIYTHHHWDHVWGACAWPDAEVIGHESGRRLLEQEAARPWSHAYLRAEVGRNPRLGPSFDARARAIPSWAGFRVRPPDRTFDDVLHLPGGIELRHVGGHHSTDSTVVGVPDSQVLLLGDCFYPPPLHLRRPTDRADLAMLGSLLDPRYAWYVGSHDEPHRDEALRALLRR
jgi:glyoxylase-like metal-dependent hydrolase (beta-lactamase superfamily II)